MSERLTGAMDQARMAQDQIDMQARAAGINVQRNAANRNEFLSTPDVQNAYAETVLAPMVGEVMTNAASDQANATRLADVLSADQATINTRRQSIETQINTGIGAGERGRTLTNRLSDDDQWFFNNFMQSPDTTRVKTGLDKRVERSQVDGNLQGMTGDAMTRLTGSIDHPNALVTIARDVNTTVNRKLGIMSDPDDMRLFAANPRELDDTQRQRLHRLAGNANITAEDYTAMQKAARAELRRNEASGTPADTATQDAINQSNIAVLRNRLTTLDPNSPEAAAALTRIGQLQAAVAGNRTRAMREGQAVGDRHDTQVNRLQIQYDTAMRRGDTLMAAGLRPRLDAARAAREVSRDRAMITLRADLTRAAVRRLTGGADTRARVGINDLDAQTNPIDTILAEAYNENRQLDLNNLVDRRGNYIQVSAEQRNGHLGRIVGRGLRRFMNTVMNGVSGRRSNELDAQVGAARNEHNDAFVRLYRNTLSEGRAEGRTDDQIRADLVNLGADDLAQLEGGIIVNQQQRAEDQRLAGLNNAVARRYARGGRITRGAMVAVPAAAVGVAAGVAAAAVLAPAAALVAAGAATAYAGRKIGHYTAAGASRGRANTAEGNRALTNRAGDAVNHYEARANANTNLDTILDHTQYVERNTIEDVRENQGRRRVAAVVGSVAAGLGFAGGVALADGMNINAAGRPRGEEAVQAQAQPEQPAPPATEAQPAPPAQPELPNVDTNQLPFDVAHEVVPGHEMEAIRGVMDPINQAHDTAYHLVRVDGHLEVYNGAHALNAAQQAQFNEYMLQTLARAAS